MLIWNNRSFNKLKMYRTETNKLETLIREPEGRDRSKCELAEGAEICESSSHKQSNKFNKNPLNLLKLMTTRMITIMKAMITLIMTITMNRSKHMSLTTHAPSNSIKTYKLTK